VDYVFSISCLKSFEAFRSGFESVMKGSAIQLFRPEELSELICGSSTMDFKVLETVTHYDGYEAQSEIIGHFWTIVHELDNDMKKKLLFFTTGTAS
jgi:hypothetical protein